VSIGRLRLIRASRCNQGRSIAAGAAELSAARSRRKIRVGCNGARIRRRGQSARSNEIGARHEAGGVLGLTGSRSACIQRDEGDAPAIGASCAGPDAIQSSMRRGRKPVRATQPAQHGWRNSSSASSIGWALAVHALVATRRMDDCIASGRRTARRSRRRRPHRAECTRNGSR